MFVYMNTSRQMDAILVLHVGFDNFVYRCTYLPTFQTYLRTYQFIHLPNYLPPMTYLFIYLPIYLPTQLSLTYFLHIYPSTYLPTCLLHISYLLIFSCLTIFNLLQPTYLLSMDYKLRTYLPLILTNHRVTYLLIT